MSPIVMILGIIVVILVVILFYYFSSSSTTLTASASLKTISPGITPIVNPTYTSYSYGIWLYINSWDANANKTIFSRSGNIRLYLDKNTPTLKCDITTTSSATPPTQTVTITDNFPIQKWTYVIVSMDNQFMEIYLDGKLVLSTRIFTPASGTTAAIMPKPPTETPPVYLGNSDTTINAQFTPFDAYIAKFTRNTTAMDPQTAWNNYMSGNGGNAITNMFSSYNVNLNILKNQVSTATYSLY